MTFCGTGYTGQHKLKTNGAKQSREPWETTGGTPKNVNSRTQTTKPGHLSGRGGGKSWQASRGKSKPSKLFLCTYVRYVIVLCYMCWSYLLPHQWTKRMPVLLKSLIQVVQILLNTFIKCKMYRRTHYFVWSPGADKGGNELIFFLSLPSWHRGQYKQWFYKYIIETINCWNQNSWTKEPPPNWIKLSSQIQRDVK